MASEVDIANRALSMLGEARITSLTDNNKGARAMNARFTILRDAELASYAWRFAVKRVQLPASTDVPAWGFSVIYDRPSDDLRMLKLGGASINAFSIGVMYQSSGYTQEDPAYEVINGRIHTNLSAPLDYEYIARITDAGAFDPLFVEALASRLALDAAEELTQSNSKKQAALYTYQKVMSDARRVNSLMRPPRMRGAGRWMQSRIVG